MKRIAIITLIAAVIIAAGCTKRKLPSVTAPEEYFTATPTFTNTFTDTHTPGPTSTFSSTFTYTHTMTITDTFTVTHTGTDTRTHTPTKTQTDTFTYTSTHTSTFTTTFTHTNTPSGTWTPIPTNTFTQTSTNTQVFTSTFTFTNTFTPTSTLTPVINRGTAVLSPKYVIASGTGNTVRIDYSAGEFAWSGGSGYGTLRITVPAGWSQPSLVTTDAGYYTVSVTNGTLYSTSVSGMDIIIKAKDLTAFTGAISVLYGSKQDGGPGADVQPVIGTPVFIVSMTNSGDTVHVIDNSPQITVINEQGNVTVSPDSGLYPSTGNTFTFTYVPSYDWDSAPSYGTLEIDVPVGFDAPSLNSADNGYFTALITGGTLSGKSIEGRKMIVHASGVTAITGNIMLIYGVKTGGGQGITVPSAGSFTFTSYANPGAGDAFALSTQPSILIQVPTQTSTVTLTSTITETATISPTASKTPTVTKTDTSTRTVTKTATQTRTITETSTASPTLTITETHTITKTWTVTATITETRTPTATKTITATWTNTSTRTSTKTVTETRTPTATRTETPTTTASITATRTPVTLSFSDPNFESAVRSYIALPTETPVMSTDVEMLTAFSAQNSAISDLTGLEYFTGLNSLILYGNSIVNIAPITGLIYLNYLDLNNNSITDISALVANSQSGGLGAGATVYLELNPLSSQAIDADIPALTTNGVTVFH